MINRETDRRPTPATPLLHSAHPRTLFLTLTAQVPLPRIWPCLAPSLYEGSLRGVICCFMWMRDCRRNPTRTPAFPTPSSPVLHVLLSNLQCPPFPSSHSSTPPLYLPSSLIKNRTSTHLSGLSLEMVCLLLAP